jgi:pimeloyl-ACP methyl ester carboxylesterase
MKRTFLTQFAPLQIFIFFFIGSIFFYLYNPYIQSIGELTFIHSFAGNNKFNQVLNIDSGYAEVNGTKLYYEVAGTGQSLVLIHGSFGDRRHWDFQFKEFSKKYKVLRYDVRGYGKSALPNPDKAYTDSEDLNALMDFLKIRKANICGLSMGSGIAIDFALSYPDKCGSLILIGPRVAGDGSAEYRTANADSVSNWISKVVTIVKNKGAKEGTDSLWTGNNPLSKAVLSSRTREALLKMGYEYSWWRYLYTNKREQVFPMAINKLGEIRIPTLIVTAEYDLALCKNVADIMAKNIPGAKLVSIKGAGHIMNMDKPKEFNKVIFKFFTELK